MQSELSPLCIIQHRFLQFNECNLEPVRLAFFLIFEAGGFFLCPDGRDKYLQHLAKNHEAMFCVEPLKWCVHLEGSVKSVPDGGLDTSHPCETCGDTTENWVCLTCYKVFCSRYVHEHMVEHNKTEPDHNLALSYSDMSIWCYSCSQYLDNPILHSARDAACKHKFGE
ncbi:HDAC6 [Acanthosepion pharaonis]|uniref:HDAC6 n=1 Tax=Acanthosepion pharaonis TaxID=158019 RepID=A0A812E907_ACAPH|nr:HDAC6 [Sepia pharaonis]